MRIRSYLKVYQNRLNKIWLFVFLFFLMGCDDCNYTIKATYIESDCPFEQSFYFQEISVLSNDVNGVPEEIEVLRTVSLSLKKSGLQPSKKIYFYRANDNYEWHDVKRGTLSNTLPIKMMPNRWYRIRALVFNGNPDRAAYIKLNDAGELEVCGYSEARNW